MSSKLPAMQFYPGDWKRDIGIQSLDLETRGAWFEILLLMHDSEERGKLLLNGEKMPDEILAKLLGVDSSKILAICSKLVASGVANVCQTTGALINRRMVREALENKSLSEKRAEAGRKGGLSKALANIANVATSSSTSSSLHLPNPEVGAETADSDVFSNTLNPMRRKPKIAHSRKLTLSELPEPARNLAGRCWRISA